MVGGGALERQILSLDAERGDPLVSAASTAGISLRITDAADFSRHQLDGPLIVAFKSVRGIFVSCPLSLDGPCLDCLRGRWLANVSAWEHPASLEVFIQSLAAHFGDPFAFELPATVPLLTTELIMTAIGGAAGICRHFDLEKGRLVEGRLWPVHGCMHGEHGSRPIGFRHLHGLPTLLRG